MYPAGPSSFVQGELAQETPSPQGQCGGERLSNLVWAARLEQRVVEGEQQGM